MNIEDIHAEILRIRTRIHDAFNLLVINEGKIFNLDENAQTLKNNLQEVEKSIKVLEKQVNALNTQSTVLKWAATIFSAVFIAIIVEQIQTLMRS